jgi:hypothetical protein
MSGEATQFKALGHTDLPPTVQIEGKPYALRKCFEHKFATAIALYERDGDRVVCKFHRQVSFAGFPLGWMGHLMAAYEEGNLRRCQGLKGVPRLRESSHPGVVAHDFVPGRPLTKDVRVSDVFFRRLFDLLDSVHECEVAYIDLEKADNVLVGEDGRPYLIDFQIALRLPRALVRWCPPARWVLRRLQKSDHYHVMKHFRRVRPDLLTSRQIARSKRKPLLVRLGNALAAPFRQIHRNFPRHA